MDTISDNAAGGKGTEPPKHVDWRDWEIAKLRAALEHVDKIATDHKANAIGRAQKVVRTALGLEK